MGQGSEGDRNVLCRRRGEDFLTGRRVCGCSPTEQGMTCSGACRGSAWVRHYTGLEACGRGRLREMGLIMLCRGFGFYVMVEREPVESFEQARCNQFVN